MHVRTCRVYVTMAELEALAEEQIVLEWNEISITLTVKLDGGKVRGPGLVYYFVVLAVGAGSG